MEPNAFAPEFLDHFAEHDEPATSLEASSSGPWRVVAPGRERWGVIQEGDAAPRAVFKDRELALVAAAMIPASGRGSPLGAPWPPTPEQVAIGRDSPRHQLAECRRLLSARQYQLFALIYLAGFSPREVSKRVGLSPGNVHAFLSGLRRALGGRGVVLRTRVSRGERGS